MKIQIAELKSLFVSILENKYSSEHSNIIAESLLYAQMSGRNTHGAIRLLPKKFGPMDENPQGEISYEKINDSMMKITGVGFPGVLLSSLATEKVISLAQGTGLGLVAYVGNHSTSGYLGHYLREIANKNLVGIMLSNCAPLVAPLGAKKRLLGTNPIGFSVPNSGGHSVVVDFGTSKISFGEAAVKLENEEELPDDGAINAQGLITKSPKELFDGGALLPFGGHKGFGLSLMIELICGPTLRAMYSGLHNERGWGNVLLAIDPLRLGADLEDYSRHIQYFLAPENTGDGFRWPGLTSYNNYLQSKKAGDVFIDDIIYQQLIQAKRVKL